MDKLTCKKNRIKTNLDEVDFRNMIKPSSYLQYFQDVTANHYAELKIDHANMLKRNKFWILSRMSVIIDNPVFGSGEVLEVSTRMRKPGTVEAFRDFYVRGGGSLRARAVSRWCVLDVESKRICKCGEFLPFPDDAYTGKPAIEPSLTKTDLRAAANDVAAHVESLKVRHCDLDYNYHMNNTRYGEIIYNACSVDQLNNRIIKGFDIHFASELAPDETFAVKRFDYQNHSLFEASKCDGTKPAFYAKIEWNT